jgi:hypothetical protein
MRRAQAGLPPSTSTCVGGAFQPREPNQSGSAGLYVRLRRHLRRTSIHGRARRPVEPQQRIPRLPRRFDLLLSAFRFLLLYFPPCLYSLSRLRPGAGPARVSAWAGASRLGARMRTRGAGAAEFGRVTSRQPPHQSAAANQPWNVNRHLMVFRVEKDMRWCLQGLGQLRRAAWILPARGSAVARATSAAAEAPLRDCVTLRQAPNAAKTTTKMPHEP